MTTDSKPSPLAVVGGTETDDPAEALPAEPRGPTLAMLAMPINFGRVRLREVTLHRERNSASVELEDVQGAISVVSCSLGAAEDLLETVPFVTKAWFDLMLTVAEAPTPAS